jgi:hypothetical protein
MISRKELESMSNAELNIKLKNLENEYLAEQKKAAELINKMEELDKLYVFVKNEIDKRNNSIWTQEK